MDLLSVRCGEFCRSGRENLCLEFCATGRDVNGGYAELMVVPERFAYRIPDIFTDAQAAPLLCAGAIGYRSLRLSGLQDGQNLGLTGLGHRRTWRQRWSGTAIRTATFSCSAAPRPNEASPWNWGRTRG